MRQVANMWKNRTREDQFGVLVEMLTEINNKKDMEIFLRTLLSESEVAYIGQRLDIMRMLSKKFEYLQIKEILHVPVATISNASIRLKEGGKKMKNILLKYKYKEEKTVETVLASNVSYGNGLVSPHYPGSIGNRRNEK